MKEAKELYKLLRTLGNEDDKIFPVVVKSVNKENNTCNVEFNELEIGDVRLQSIIDEDVKGAVNYPAIGSVVLVSKLSDKGEYFIVMFSELEEFSLNIDKTVFKQNSNGFKISKNEIDFIDVMLDFIKAVKQLKVICSSEGTPSVNVVNVLDFVAVENKLKKIFY